MPQINRALCVALCLLFSFLPSLSSDRSATAADTVTLADAIEQRDWDQATRLLDDQPVDRRQADGTSALHWAVQHGQSDWVERLIRHGADVNAKNEYGVPPLAIAARNGNSACTRQLLEAGADANERLPGEMTALMLASGSGDVATVRLLLQHDAKVNAKQRDQQTPLMFAAAGGHAGVIDVLLDAGADPDYRLDSGYKPMFFAARNGHIDATMAFLDRGFDISETMKPKRTPDRSPRKGMTALMLAVESGHFELAMRLVERGADPNDEASEFAPLHALTWVRRPQRGDNPAGDPPPRGSGRLNSLQFVRQIVKAGADVNLQLRRGRVGAGELTPRGATPFLMASLTLDLPLMELLLELGADPTLVNHDGTTALMAAAGIGVKNIVDGRPGTPAEADVALRRLVDLGLDINAVDKNGETVMHGAAYRCFPETVRLVAELGADPAIWDQKNKHGWTPLLIAKGYRPGAFKPDLATVDAVLEAMGDRANGADQEGKSLDWQEQAD